ncbi:MAG: hypothetical protein QNJ34_12255 [Xenococcaceae cyanobacterium MO_188.B29]|nr:hypothetical protein [Xenococcaceae cyanobacterium MO_188.B29]
MRSGEAWHCVIALCVPASLIAKTKKIKAIYAFPLVLRYNFFWGVNHQLFS